MATEYISELGDKLSKNSSAENLPKHIKVISAPNYVRVDNGVVSNPSLQSALDGKVAKSDTAYLIQKSRESYYPSSSSWASIGSLCDGNATTSCTIKWPSDVITKNLTFSSSRGTVTFQKKGMYHVEVSIPLQITQAAPDTQQTTNYVWAYLAVYKSGSSDTAGYAYKRANVNRRLSELNTYFLDLDFDAVVNDDNAIMTGEVEFHGLNISGSDGCEITVHQPTASITRVADV